MKSISLQSLLKQVSHLRKVSQFNHKDKSILLNNLLITAGIILFTFFSSTMFSGCSGKKAQVKQPEQVLTKEKPTEQPPKLPEFNSDEQKFLEAFNPLKLPINPVIKNSSEVYTSDNFRAYAFNEYTDGKITTYMYGGASEDNMKGRWFCEKVMQWDPAAKTWKQIFDSGMNFNSSINKDIPVNGKSWYYTAQWVWDPLAKEWLRFDSNLLFQRS